MNREFSEKTKRKLASISIVASVSMLMIMFGVQREEIEEAPFKASDRITKTEYVETTFTIVEVKEKQAALRDEQLFLLRKIVCEEHNASVKELCSRDWEAEIAAANKPLERTPFKEGD